MGPGQIWPISETFPWLKPVRVEVNPGVSLFLDPNDLIGRAILRSGRWQPAVWKSISDGLSSGAIFFDVGAHIGYESLRASVQIGDRGKVIAFEPNPATLGQLRANISASKATNIIVEPIACADQEGRLTLYDSTSEGNSGASSLSLSNADETGKGALPSYVVRARPIDDVAEELAVDRLDVMKVDVEGAEVLVLRGARKTLRRFHPKLVVEVRSFQLENMHSSVDELFSFVEGLGYGPGRQIDGDDWEWVAK
jgi:FkbM family methyltransferase